MPSRKRPTAEDAATARRMLLDGLARGTDTFEMLGGLAPLHPRNDTFPGEVFLRLAADALEWCGASPAEPLPLEGLRERFLPECAFRGRQNAKLQYAVLAAAAVHGGTEPDLLDEAASWQADDFWQYAMYAAVAYIRAAASRAGVPVHQACQNLNESPGHPAPCRLRALSRRTLACQKRCAYLAQQYQEFRIAARMVEEQLRISFPAAHARWLWHGAVDIMPATLEQVGRNYRG